MLPILLIHGFPLDASMWQHQTAHLRHKNRTVLTPNLPGFGGTTPLPPGQSTIEAFARHIHAVIQNETAGQAIVGGFSMGGYTLLALLRDFPRSVAAAIFIDTRAQADTPEARDVRLKSIETVQSQGPEPVIETMLARLLAPSATPALKLHVRGIMNLQPPEALIAAQTAMANRRDQTEILAHLAIPSLIIVGQHDAITPPAVGQAMHSQIPSSTKSTLIEIPGAGHLTPLEAPSAVNTALDNFLAALPNT